MKCMKQSQKETPVSESSADERTNGNIGVARHKRSSTAPSRMKGAFTK